MQQLSFVKNVINFFFLHWVFIAELRLCLIAARGSYSLAVVHRLSQPWLPWLCSTGSGQGAFSSCGACSPLLRSMWNLPGPGIEPMFPTLAGGFLSTAPPGKSQVYLLINHMTLNCFASRFHYIITWWDILYLKKALCYRIFWQSSQKLSAFWLLALALKDRVTKIKLIALTRALMTLWSHPIP